MVSTTITISNTTKRKLTSLRFEHLKNAILGEKYELSVVFIGKTKMQGLNKKYRNIDKSTDILSFPISPDHGEIFISILDANKKAKDFDRSEENYLEFLFIHGLVHLIGFDHGKEMEEVEKKYRKKFSI